MLTKCRSYNAKVRPGWITWFIFFANFSFCNFILLSLFIAVILENFEVAEAEKMKLQANMRETKMRKARFFTRNDDFATKMMILC